MRINMVGAFIRNAPFGTEIAFAKGMERRGHEVIRIDTSYENQAWDQNADATLVFKWMDRDWDKLDGCRGPKIVYQPDDARFPHIREMVLKMREHVDCLLTFDDYGVTLAKQLGYRDAEYMLLTADDELYCPDSAVERDIDVSFVGSLTHGPNHASRYKMCEIAYEEAQKRGWKTWFGEAYFDGQDVLSPVDIYRRSKVVLNHATDVGQNFGTGFGLQCRHFEVGMTKTCLLSNSVIGYPDRFDLPFAVFGDGWGLKNTLQYLIDGGWWRTIGDPLYQNIMAKHGPEHRADQLVAFIERNS